MSLASAIPAMTEAMGSIVSVMNGGDESINVGEQWAVVAEAFFENGINPAWTPAGLAAGKLAFSSAFGSTLETSSDGSALASALSKGFHAFAGLATSPENAAPGLPAQLVPITPPPAPPVIATITSPASDSHESIITEIHPKLASWALAGLVSVTTPSGPVPTTPWS